MATKTSELYEEELNMINSKVLREITRQTLNEAPECIAWIPASSSGKYHSIGDCKKGEVREDGTIVAGGLVFHTKADIACARVFMDCEVFKQLIFGINNYPTNETMLIYRDVVIVSLLLHDCCKAEDSDPKHTTKFDHPLRASHLFKEICKKYLHEHRINEKEREYVKTAIPLIAGCIASHMGQYNSSKYSTVKLPTPKNNLELLVHLADMYGSRRYIDIDLEKYYGKQ